MARGVDGRTIFIDREDHERFLRALARVRSESSATLIAYCLMNNHFHLAIKVGNIPLGMVMQRILTSYSLSFNLKHDRNGHLFQARYKAYLCGDDAYLASLIRYIHMNPVRAGLTSHPDQWCWSSYADYKRQGHDGLVDTMADIPDLDSPPPQDFLPWPVPTQSTMPILLRPETNECPDIESIVSECIHESGLTPDVLRSGSRSRNVTRIKRLIVQRGIRSGFTLTSLARRLNISLSSVCHYLGK